MLRTLKELKGDTLASTLCLVRITCPDQQVALVIAQNAIGNQIAACANIDGPVKAIYRWQGKIEQSEEFILWLKAPVTNIDRIEALVKQHHPHDVPAIVAMHCLYTNAAYALWASETTNGAH